MVEDWVCNVGEVSFTDGPVVERANVGTELLETLLEYLFVICEARFGCEFEER